MFTKKHHDPVETMGKPSISYIAVTPEMAERWLKSNTVNRSIRETKVNQYAADMKAGRWTHSADMICFSTDGLLLNGQHRLLAVVASGCTVTFPVQRNVPAEAMQNMDTGAARKVSDVLRWRGEVNTPLLGSAAKMSILIADGRIYKNAKVQAVSHGEITDFVDLNPSLRDSVAVAQHAYQRGVDCPPTALAVSHHLIWEANSYEAATGFLERLATRVGEPELSPVLALDRRFREIRRNRAQHQNREYVALIVRAWNLDAQGKGASKLQIVQKGEFRIPKVVSKHVRTAS